VPNLPEGEGPLGFLPPAVCTRGSAQGKRQEGSRMKYCAGCGHPDHEHHKGVFLGSAEEGRPTVNICCHVPSKQQAETTGLMRCDCDGWLDPPEPKMTQGQFETLYMGQFPVEDGPYR